MVLTPFPALGTGVEISAHEARYDAGIVILALTPAKSDHRAWIRDGWCMFAGADFFILVLLVVLGGAFLDWGSVRGLRAAALQVCSLMS